MTPEELVIQLKVLNLKDQVELIQQAKSEWCKEQRENCAFSYEKQRGENLVKIIAERDDEVPLIHGLHDAILKAPEP